MTHVGINKKQIKCNYDEGQEEYKCIHRDIDNLELQIETTNKKFKRLSGDWLKMQHKLSETC